MEDEEPVMITRFLIVWTLELWRKVLIEQYNNGVKNLDVLSYIGPRNKIVSGVGGAGLIIVFDFFFLIQ